MNRVRWRVGAYANAEKNQLCRLKKEKIKGEEVLVPVPISRYAIEYVKLINNGVSTNQMAVKFIDKEEIYAPILTIDSILIKEGLIGKENTEAKKFISAMTNAVEILEETRIDGGYVSLAEIKKPKFKEKEKDLASIQKYIINYMINYFTPEMLTAFKLLILMPFHWIVKNDVDAVKKELVKGLSLFGPPDTAKTLIALYTMNIFVKQPLSLDSEAEIFDSLAGFRGKLCRKFGITLIDEFNKLLTVKEIKQSLNDLVNGIPTLKISIQGVSGGGDITNDKYIGTPVFTSNVKPQWNNSNLKRLDVIEMKTAFKPDVKISITKGKRLLLLFGELIAYAFKENYQEIIACTDSLEASETLLSKIDGLDLTGIVLCPDCRTDSLKQMPLSILVKKDLERRAKHGLDNYIDVYYGDYDLPWLIKQTNNYLFVEQNLFFEYLRDLIGDQSVDIKEYLADELVIETRSVRMNGVVKRIPSIYIKDFEDWLGLHDSTEDIDVEVIEMVGPPS